MYHCQNKIATPDQKFKLLVNDNGRTPLVFSATGYEVTKDCEAGNLRMKWIEEELGGSLECAKNAFRTRAFVESFMDGAAAARFIVDKGNGNYRSDIKWLRVGVDEMRRFELSSTKSSIEIRGPLFSPQEVKNQEDADAAEEAQPSAPNLIGICFECVSRTSSVKLPYTSILDLKVNSADKEEDDEGENPRVCVNFAPLLVCSAAQYYQSAENTPMTRSLLEEDAYVCHGKLFHTLHLYDSDLSYLLLNLNNVKVSVAAAAVAAEYGQLHNIPMEICHSLVPARQHYYLDLNTHDEAPGELSSRRPFNFFESGAKVQDGKLCIMVLLGALQRFHCEFTVSVNQSLKGTQMPDELIHETLYFSTDRFPQVSFRELARQRGFGALCRYVLRAFRNEHPHLIRTRKPSNLSLFRAEWFTTMLSEALTYIIEKEGLKNSELTVRCLLEENYADTLFKYNMIEIREAEPGFEMDTLRKYYGKRHCRFLFFLSIDLYLFGKGDMSNVVARNGKVFLTHEHLVCRPSKKKFPWLVTFFTAIMNNKKSSSKIPRSLDSYERVLHVVRNVQDDLPIKPYMYSLKRSKVLDDWPRVPGRKRQECYRKNLMRWSGIDNYVSAAGMEPGILGNNIRKSTDSLRDTETSNWVELTPFSMSATLRSSSDLYRDVRLVRDYKLKPDTDVIDSLRERRALPPCLVGMDERSRGHSYANPLVGYKHYDRLDHAKILYSMVPDVINSDEEIQNHIVELVKSSNHSKDFEMERKVSDVRTDVVNARKYYDKKKKENMDHMIQSQGWNEDTAEDRCTGCLTCDSIAKEVAQKASASNLRCPFASLANKSIDRKTFAKYLDASASSAPITDIEDLKFSQTSQFTSIADYLQGKDKSAQGINPKRACVKFLRVTRFKSQKEESEKVSNLVLYHPRDYTRVALHVESRTELAINTNGVEKETGKAKRRRVVAE